MIAISDSVRKDMREFGSFTLATAFALGILLLHSRERLAFAQSATPSPALIVPTVPHAVSLNYPRLLRDPFAEPWSVLQNAGVYAGSSLIGMHVVAGTPFISGLPPNAGAAQTPLGSDRASALLVAVASGPDARALVEIGGTLRIVAIGDHLGESVVTKIGTTGIVLSDGERLTSIQSGPTP